MYSAILVTLDGSQSSAAAIPHALEMARAFDARVVLLRVLADVPGDDDWTQREHDARQAQAYGYLDSLKKSLTGQGVAIETVTANGDPATVILATARGLGQSLIVLSAYGRTRGKSHGDVGQVARRILQEAEGPVMLVRPDAQARQLEAAGRAIA